MRIGPDRPVSPEAIEAPSGCRVEALITGLNFPTSISFGPGGELYLAEGGGVAGRNVCPPRVLRIDPDRSVNEIGRLENRIASVVYRAGELFIGEDGPQPRILRVTADGELRVVIEGLPGGGDYGLSGLALDGMGNLIFGIGTRTNSGVVGEDNVARGWVDRLPQHADLPGTDVLLNGVNYVTSQSAAGGTTRSVTGGFKPFGCRSEADEAVAGSHFCSGAVFRMPSEGGVSERIAWGLRNPIGIAAGPDSRIFVTEGGMEERGSRPIAGAPDVLWELKPGGNWYGWPDFVAGIPVTDPRYRLPGHPQPSRLLQGMADPRQTPIAGFNTRSGIGRVDYAFTDALCPAGHLLVALAGAWSLGAYGDGGGRPAIVSVHPGTGHITHFMSNRADAGRAGLARPFDVRLDPTGEILYVVDLGEVDLSRQHGLEPFGGTGVVWRITRRRSLVSVAASFGESDEDDEADEDGQEPGDELDPEPDADDDEGDADEADSDQGDVEDENAPSDDEADTDESTASADELRPETGTAAEPQPDTAHEELTPTAADSAAGTSVEQED